MNGSDLIAQERARQYFDEGYDGKHDDTHVGMQLVTAAIHYLRPNLIRWPWSNDPKLEDEMRNLVKAGALIAAEIDRRLRKGVNG